VWQEVGLEVMSHGLGLVIEVWACRERECFLSVLAHVSGRKTPNSMHQEKWQERNTQKTRFDELGKGAKEVLKERQ